MKRNRFRKKSLLSLVFLLIISVFFLACSGSGGGIYATIEREVKLNNRSIVNIVYRMTQFGDNLYSCNGSLSTKNVNAGPGWTHVAVQGVSGHIVSVAADSTYIYVLAADGNDVGTVYASTDGTNYTSTGLTGNWNNGGCWLFDNKAKDSANRKAYFNSGSVAYQLAGTGAATSTGGNYRGAAFWGGATHFHDTEAITANYDETAGWKSTDLVVNDNNTPPTNLWGGNIKSLTYFNGTYLFAGFDSTTNGGGYKAYNFGSSTVASVNTPNAGLFSGSAIFFLRNINGVIYMSVSTQPAERCGLWSYYPGDSNWNME